MNNTSSKSVDNLIVENIAAFAKSSQIWEGTMTDLSNEISTLVNRGSRKYLPGSASALRKVIDRNIRRIRVRGVSVQFTRTADKSRTRLVTIVSK